LATVVDDPDRSKLRWLLSRPDLVDVLIPRGSPSLIDYCRNATSIPVIASGGGVNHLFVHASADLPLAVDIALNSKLSEPTACNALELVLVERGVAQEFTTLLRAAARGHGGPVTLRLDPALDPNPNPAPAPDAAPAAADGVPDGGGTLPDADRVRDLVREEALSDVDFGREVLEPSLGVLVVDGLDAAVAHVRRHGSAHTEGIVAGDAAAVAAYTRAVDAAAVIVNGSLRLHDGPTMGLGPELSISTGRLHVRGPVALDSLLTRQWVVSANGTLRR
jgi:glutamate-5-semialdehyde dehydrogenase